MSLKARLASKKRELLAMFGSLAAIFVCGSLLTATHQGIFFYLMLFFGYTELLAGAALMAPDWIYTSGSLLAAERGLGSPSVSWKKIFIFTALFACAWFVIHSLR
ncbi:hypothetical protein [Magnetofaba australis]|uniref:hypothetical protein n=1 Tax=Magnetofaba australis TaxID=1472297 RepID=UPI000A19CA68|nr:hypothetical protein [Magnetofaba australis]